MPSTKSDLVAPTRVHRVKDKVQAHAVGFSADGARVAIQYAGFSSRQEPNRVLVWDIDRWRHKKLIRGCSESVDDVAFTFDSQTLICAGNSTKRFMGGEINLWNTDGWKSRLVIEGDDLECTRRVATSPNGKYFATGSALSGTGDNKVQIWDAEGNCIRRFATLNGDVQSLQFSPDGKSLAVGVTSDRTASVWSIPGGRKKWMQRAHADANHITTVFSPDGKLLATCADRNIALWDAKTGKRQALLKGHGNDVRTIAFSPDGALLVSASFRQICLWDVASGRPLGSQTELPYHMIGLSLSANHQELVGVHSINDEVTILKFDLALRSSTVAQAAPQAAKKSPQEKELIAAVIADPDNDAPRLAYAQWLEERDDPRGEFIRRQISRQMRQGKRAKTLLEEHFAEWTAPLASLQLQPSIAEFSRGFLHELRLCDIDVGDDTLELLRHVPELERLTLDGSGVTDAGMRHLKGVTNLAELNVSETAVTPEAAQELKRLKRLVLFHNYEWGNRKIDAIEKWKITRNSRFKRLPAEQQRVEAIRALSLIVSYMRPKSSLYKSISYSQSWASDADLVYLQAIPEVEELDFFECRAVTSQGLKHLRPLKKLRKLSLSESGVTDLAPLRHLMSVEDLELDSLEQLDPRSFRHLAALPNLQRLTVRFCRLGDEILKHIGQCAALREMDLIYNKFTAAGLEHLRNLKSLEKIDFDYIGEHRQLVSELLNKPPTKRKGK